MDPFTEKLLERTRARRENLQKKLAERPTAASRQMVKRPREPLTDTNSIISDAVPEKVVQAFSKPSPSKRRYSEENAQPSANEENREPVVPRAGAPELPDPPTDKKPPLGPAGVRYSLEKAAARPAVQSEPLGKPESEKMVAPPGPELLSRDAEMEATVSVQQRMEEAAAPSGGMKSRLQKLAEQRKCWDGIAQEDCTPVLLLKRDAEVSSPAAPASSSEMAVGRRGRLANLAATIGSWEDDLSHVNIPREKPAAVNPSKPNAAGNPSKPNAAGNPSKPNAAGNPSKPNAAGNPSKPDAAGNPSKPNAAVYPSKPNAAGNPSKPDAAGNPSKPDAAVYPSKPTAAGSPSKPTAAGNPSKPTAAGSPSKPTAAVYLSKPTPVGNLTEKSIFKQGVVQSPVKSSQMVPPNLQKADFPPPKPALQSAQSPLKSSNQGAASTSTTQNGCSSSASVPQSPSRGLNTYTPQKPELHDKPSFSSSTAQQKKVPAGTPGVKSFLERFGEKCQERVLQTTPARVPLQPRAPAGPPSTSPNTRLLQEKLMAAQSASTATADLTMRQKLERESELAQIRSRFQKGNSICKSEKETETSIKEPDQRLESDATAVQPQDEPRGLTNEEQQSPLRISPAGPALMVSPPASASSPLKHVSKSVEKKSDETPEEEEEVIKETEMNVDQSINSAVINELFDGVLEQSDDRDEEEEEEDALNISSMSLFIPLTETVTSVVKSPEGKVMTSTPANSFLVKNNPPENLSKPSKFQRGGAKPTASSGCADPSDEDLKLPYSIDAYRSTRVKEAERPHVKQVIVRKEDVTERADEPRGSTAFSIRQKMKILTSEMNLQQTVIHQASQALNCCTDEEHGKGSQVEAEAERLLLVATEKREALKAELERLKGDPTGQKKASGAPEPSLMSASKGSITLQELRLPLKADFVCSTANRPESTKHSFFILIRAGAEDSVATPLASTHRGLSGDTLTFPTKFSISDVSSDFHIQLQVYCLVQKHEVCSEKKKKPSKSKMMWRQVHEAHSLCLSAITPKRFLAITSAHTPVMASPGGPNAVRTSNFVMVGSHTLTLSSIGKNKFPLEKVSFLCPLEGHVYLKLHCEVGSKVEEKGFLTMFEDVSGFGAWHRRWCVLSGYCISYWTYPDDEKRKNPIGRINLTSCTSKKVEPANREFCARPNTFELVTVRPQREGDKETLVSQCTDALCVTTNWLSADTKEERNLWMKKLNHILLDLRTWQPDACHGPQ
ncbi:anillin isoform X3 [Oryzias latipes]|uniref:anillin isoform X3 n=1 Tax=Oryzias latipes TaxID=8090 RepID=UPI000CE1FC82|nr:anillin isoform X3 [Oryzias latipes]